MNRFDLVIFMGQEWTFPCRASFLAPFVAERLGDGKVLCVLRPISLTPAPAMHGRRLLGWLSGRDRLRRVSRNLFIFRPWIFVHDHLAARMPWVVSHNRRALTRQLKRVLEGASFRSERLVSWIHDPYQEWCMGLLGESLCVYDCYDEYSASSALPLVRPIAELVTRERRVLDQADVVFVVSQALYDMKKELTREIHVVPNAVDVQHFASASKKSIHIPEDVAHLPRPLIGSIGAFSDRLDLSLLLAVAQQHPDWSLVFVGRRSRLGLRTKTAALARQLGHAPNFRFLGPRRYEALPGYLKAFDVCLIPYLTTHPFNIHCSPLKLYEYLASGRPIVSTDLPAVRPFQDVVRIAEEPRGFIGNIEEALAENGRLVTRRLEVARDNSWEVRATQITQALGHALEGIKP